MNDYIIVKNKLSLYYHYQRKIKDCNEKLEVIAVKMQGVKSSSNYPPVPNDNPSYRNNIVELMDEEQELISIRQECYDELAKLDKLIDSISNEEDRNLISDCYRKFMKYDELVEKYKYSGKQVIYRKINRILDNL